MHWFKTVLAYLGHFRWVLTHELIPVLWAKYRYWRSYYVVKEKAQKGEKIRVLFLVNEISKWKAQSLYEYLLESKYFEPIVALTLTTDLRDSLSPEAQHAKYEMAYAFFEARGIHPVEAYCLEEKSYRTIESLKADIVFYFQPWGLPLEYMPYETAKTALTCYIPYYVPNYGDVNVECRQPFHRTLWTYFILNEEWASLYQKALSKWMSSCRIIGAGHPMLDCFNSANKVISSQEYVIYAPHWSLDEPQNQNFENYGTFNLNGEYILDFAKKHADIHWVFKPHPDLRKILLKIGWSPQRIENYYTAWEQIGTRCETGDYPTLFMQSRLLITDCGSFLTEYACTGNPILHLISPTCKLVPYPQSKQLYDLYYQAHNREELEKLFNQLVLCREDPLRDLRLAMIRKMKLCGNNAGQAIEHWLETQLLK